MSNTTITADEGIANGYGDFSLIGSSLHTEWLDILDKDDFYNGDGCYTFEVEIENDMVKHL